MRSSSKRVIILLAILALLIVICLVLVVGILPGLLANSSRPPGSSTPTPKALGPVADSIQQAIAAQTDPVFLMQDTQVDYLTLSTDNNWATAQLTPKDPETGEIIPTEPGLAIAILDGGEWRTILPSDPEWTTALRSLPPELLSGEEKNAWLEIAAEEQALLPAAPLGGYHLPWADSEVMVLTQSIGHDRYTPSKSAHFAFDFATPGYPKLMFNVHAAQDGVVRQAVWHHPNGSEGHAKSNFLILEDPRTSPTTYQLYLHLAQDSIPPELRTPGAKVRQGQFIGIADDTGVSSSHHLHFHVHTNPSSYWGRAVDIYFVEVPINGGRPRIPSDSYFCRGSDICDQTQYSYTSENTWLGNRLYFPFLPR